MALNDRELLARTLQAEAGNQGFGGMIAAGSVIMNRLGSNGSLRNVILKPGQFSAWNSVTGYAGGEQGQNMDFTPSAEAYKAADALLSGKYQDPTGGATHYYNPSISTPSWGQEAGGQWTKIGAHLFGTPSGEKRTTTPRVNAGEVSPMDGQQPMQQQMPQQGPQGLMGFLRDPRTRQVLSAFSRSGVGQRLGQIAAQDYERQLQQQNVNRTAEWLRSQPNGELFATAIEAGMPASQVYEAYRASLTGDYVVVGKTLVDRKTGKVVFQAPQTATMTRYNPTTGQYETISGVDPSQLKLTEGQGKATLFAGRMQAANAILERYEDQGTDIGQAVLGIIPFGKLAQSPEFKLYRQAKEDFINAILRQESGAAIGKDEFDRADQQYFPQPNDPPEVIEQKRRNRERAVELLKLSAGEAAPLIDQQLNLMADQIKGGAVAATPAQDGNASSKGNTLE
jgi:hypothetical protein